MYSFTSRVRYSECDETGQLSLAAAMNYLQDCSTFHCEEVGCGIAGLAERGLGWILGIWEIELAEELPRFASQICVSTWCYDMKSLRARRCFTVEDETGAPCVRADSQWYLYDLVHRRVTRVPEDEQAYREDTPRLDLPELPRKIVATGPLEDASPVTIGERHLDTNRHVNNVQYVLLATDALAELGKRPAVRRLQVQYRAQALLGDVVVPRVSTEKDGFVVDLANEAGESYAVVRIFER